MDRPCSVLFISQRNSVRSLMAEAVVNCHGKGRFRAYSAAVDPAAAIDPATLQVLEQAGYSTEGLHPKHWRKFTGPDAPVLDFMFTLSDTASREAFPDWPGKPVAGATRINQDERRGLATAQGVRTDLVERRATDAHIHAAPDIGPLGLAEASG